MDSVRTYAELANALNRHARTIQNYVKSGMPRNEDGTYDVEACRQWIDDNKGPGGRPTHKQQMLAYEQGKRPKQQLDEIKIEMLTLDLEEKRGRLIAVDEVDRFCERTVTYATSVLGEIVAKVEAKLPGDLADETRTMIRNVIESETNECLMILADLLDRDPDYDSDNVDAAETS